MKLAAVALLCALGTLVDAYRDEREGNQIQSQLQGPGSEGDYQLQAQGSPLDPPEVASPLTSIGVTVDGKSVSLATRPRQPASNASEDTLATSQAEVAVADLRGPSAETLPDGSLTLGATPHLEDGSQADLAAAIPIMQKLQALKGLSFGANAFGMPLPLPPPGEGACLARTVILHFEGLKDAALDQHENAGADDIMYVICASSLLILLFGYALVNPTIILATAGVVWHVTFVSLVYTTGDCKIPVYGGLIATVPAMLMASRVMSLGFFAMGAATGAVVAMEGQKLLFSVAPQVPKYLEVHQMTSVYYVTTIVCALVCGSALVGQINAIFMLATAFLGAFGLQVGVRGILASRGQDGITEIHGLMMLFVFFCIGYFVQSTIAKYRKKETA